MAQDQATGAAGDAFGREMAPRIAEAIGAVMLGSGSNEATYRGSRIVIKSAAQNTTSVGVTYAMLEHLDAVFGAFQRADGYFDVLSLPASVFAEEQRTSKSRGPSEGKVGLVSRSVFKNKGRLIQSVAIDANTRAHDA